MSRHPRMLVVANTDWFLANFMLGFLREHAERGMEVIVASPNGPRVSFLKEAGFDWRPVPMARGRGTLREAWRSVRALRRLMDSVRPDLVHLTTGKAVLLGALASVGNRSAIFIHVLPGLGHAFSTGGLGSWIDRTGIVLGVRWAARLPRRLTIFHQPADRDRILGHGAWVESRTRIIPGWGVDLDRFGGRRRENRPPLVVMISRMLWTKGVGEFVEAARMVAGTQPARIALVGDTDPGNPSAVDPAQLRAWAEDGAVEWWGHRDDIPEILSQAALCVLPTKYGEGVPQSLIEAAAAGVPVVASDIPGCREVVVDGETGVLVPPGDPSALAKAIAGLLADPAARARLGSSARKRARRMFSVTVQADAFRREYRSLGLEEPWEARQETP